MQKILQNAVFLFFFANMQFRISHYFENKIALKTY